MSNPRPIPDKETYANDVDFSVLALQSPEFGKYLRPNNQLDFSNPDAVRQLTISLLKRDFGLDLQLPEDRLCPPDPIWKNTSLPLCTLDQAEIYGDIIRFPIGIQVFWFNYILWIQELLDTTGPNFTDNYDPERDVVGLDIGTGASCIYPLLGCSTRPKWKFAATEIDSKNINYAQTNILANNLKSRIRPLHTESTDPLIPLDTLGLESIDFTICNPPFYASQTDLLASSTLKSRPPHSSCTGTPTEMVTPGGELAFVSRMIEESLLLRHRVKWYTTMLGKYSSVSAIVSKLRSQSLEGEEAGGTRIQIENIAVKEFIQGSRTRRWAVGWSFGSMRPSVSASRGISGSSSLGKGLLPYPTEFSFSIGGETNGSGSDGGGSIDLLETAISRTNNLMNEFPTIQWRYRASMRAGVGFANANVWSRAARRKTKLETDSNTKSKTKTKSRMQVGGREEGEREVEMDSEEEDSGDESESEPALGFKITFLSKKGHQETKGREDWEERKKEEVEIVVRWLLGRDSVLFESFVGMLRRRIA